MDKSCHYSADSVSSTTTSGSSGGGGSNPNPNSTRDQYLKHLNKLSHKISKPTGLPVIKKPPGFDLGQNQNQQAPISAAPAPAQQLIQSQNQSNLPPQQHQPPVYNINKNDFRDVVQKLTGSPAHERFSAAPPPIHLPKPQSSRLQRIRPPPLVQISNRPPPLLNCAAPNTNPNSQSGFSVPTESFIHRPSAPLSPLPPFPTVHAAAESPVSAYMRYLQNSNSSVDSSNQNQKQFSGFMPLAPLVSPRWNNLAAPQHPLPLPPPPQQGTSSATPQYQLPSSPLPFGCLSPRSPYPLLFSPNSGQFGLPLSPTVPAIPSPTWKGH